MICWSIGQEKTLLRLFRGCEYMKTKVSIPDPIFKRAEVLTSRLGMSRSEFYSKAVEAFVSPRKCQGVTENLNEVYAGENNSLDDECYLLQQKSLAVETNH